MRIDLHTHSTDSDGTDLPGRLPALAREAGLDVLALTDHDSAAGWTRAEAAAREAGIVLVRGVEVSCERHGRSIHLLSYLHDPSAPGLRAELEEARDSRVHRARRMVERLAQDYPITWADVAAQVSDGATIGRPHLADALVANGVIGHRDEAFAGMLANGSRYHVPHYAPDPVDAVRLVREAGGVPVLAHPFAPSRGRPIEEGLIEEMIEAGLAGLEVDHRDQDDPARSRLREIAAAHDLVVTGSSDYHGDGKRNRLGENLTERDQFEQLVAQGGLELVGAV